MRALPNSLAAALASGTTTLCRCWQIDRRDGVTLGFTDHDRDLSFDGVLHLADAALAAGALELSTGLGIDNQEVSGALSADAIREEDILKGFYDGAAVRQYLVDWQDVASRILLSAGQVGEVRRQGAVFEAEILGLAERLNRPFGRVYATSCAPQAGSPRLPHDPEDPALNGTGTVAEIVSEGVVLATGLEAHGEALFANGRIVWLTGANAGAEGYVRRHVIVGGQARLELWNAPPLPAAAGDTFRAEAGQVLCPEEHKARHGDLIDYPGFPHMPGDDFAAGYPEEGGTHDGGSLFRS